MEDDFGIPYEEAPDDLGLSFFLTAFCIHKNWRLPAYCGLMGVLWSGQCKVERAMRRREKAKQTSTVSTVFFAVGAVFGLLYFLDDRRDALPEAISHCATPPEGI